MARRSKKNKHTASFEGVGKGFADGQEYLVRVKECTVEEGDSAPYLSFKLEGTGEFEGSVMYHNGSLAPASLWRTRELFEAFLGEVPQGDFDVEEVAEEFVSKTAMCSTFADTYNGSKRIKPEDFWANEGEVPEEEGAGDEVDLDELEDNDIKKIGKAMGIKSKRASTIRKELSEADVDELEEVLTDLGLIKSDADGNKDSEFDLDELEDNDIKELAEALGIKVTARSRANSLKKKLVAMDEDEVAEAWEELAEGGDKPTKGGDEIDPDAVNGMDQDGLEGLVEEFDLDIDLDSFKTLRKKRTALIDAAEEAGVLAED